MSVGPPNSCILLHVCYQFCDTAVRSRRAIRTQSVKYLSNLPMTPIYLDGFFLTQTVTMIYFAILFQTYLILCCR